MRPCRDRPAAEFTVNSTADTAEPCTPASCTLRGAIIASNASGGGDDTVVLPAGTFPLSLTDSGADAAATGDLDVLDDITIRGAGLGATIVDGSALEGRMFEVLLGGEDPATFEDLTLTGAVSDDGGSVIHSDASQLTLRRVAVTDSEGERIIDSEAAELLLEDSRVTGSFSDDETIDTEDVFGSNTTTIRGSTISDNEIRDEEERHRPRPERVGDADRRGQHVRAKPRRGREGRARDGRADRLQPEQQLRHVRRGRRGGRPRTPSSRGRSSPTTWPTRTAPRSASAPAARSTARGR